MPGTERTCKKCGHPIAEHNWIAGCLNSWDAEENVVDKGCHCDERVFPETIRTPVQRGG